MDDLRVPIGSFFVILGVMLLIAFFTISTAPPLVVAASEPVVWFGGAGFWRLHAIHGERKA